jgi:hypothetical protein
MATWMRGKWGNGGMGRWGGGYMNAVMYGYMIAWLWEELRYGVMEDWMNEVIFAWAHGSRYGTTGKNRNLNIPNSKERGTTALIKIQDPMNLPPHSPISPSPLLDINQEAKMRKFNPSPGPVIDPATKNDVTISMLINSIYYFIECVFILRSKNKYRLVALQHSRVLMDKEYPTENGCRIAFARFFKNKAWDETIKPEWSHFYDPDKDWFEEKQRRLENG